MRKNGWLYVMQGLSYLTQVGLSIAAPIVLMLLLASWLIQSAGVGSWVYVPALVLGLGAGACSFAGFARYVTRKSKDKGEPVGGLDGPIYVPGAKSMRSERHYPDNRKQGNKRQ